MFIIVPLLEYNFYSITYSLDDIYMEDIYMYHHKLLYVLL